MWSQTEICMSTIWKAFLPAHCLQQSQIIEVYNTSSNINDTFYSVIHPWWSWSALQVHHIKFSWAITGTATHVLGPPLHSVSVGRSRVMLLGEELLHSPQSPSSGICFGTRSSFEPQRPIQTHFNLKDPARVTVTHEKTCSTLDFAMIEGKNLSSVLCLYCLSPTPATGSCQ